MKAKVNITMISEERIEAIESSLSELIELVRSSNGEGNIEDRWIESARVREILGVSAKTWQTYRDRRLIPFSQIGHKIYVSIEDLNDFMSEHRISKKE